MNLSVSDIFIIVIVVVAIAIAILYTVSRKNYKKVIEAEDFIAANKQTASIFVIDKKNAKPTEKDLGKNVFAQLDSKSKNRKLCMIKAKVGPQIVTLISDKNVFDVLVPKKTYKVELSGLYIVGIVGINLANKKKKTIREKLTVFSKENSKDVAKKIVK